MVTRQQLKHIRLSYGLSYREVAEASKGKISHTIIFLIEKGERTLNQETGLMILDALYRANEQQAVKRARKERRQDEENASN